MAGQHGRRAASKESSPPREMVGRYTEVDPEAARPRTVRGRYIRRDDVANSDPNYEGAYMDADSDPREIKPDGKRGHYTQTDPAA